MDERSTPTALLLVMWRKHWPQRGRLAASFASAAPEVATAFARKDYARTV